MSEDGAALTYNGTEGYSGSEASRMRAEGEARDGTVLRRQQDVMHWVQAAGVSGVTWRDLGEVTGLHHGQITGALSNLHRAGKIARLTQRRGRCSVYVAHEYVGDRRIAPPAYTWKNSPEVREAVQRVEKWLNERHSFDGPRQADMRLIIDIMKGSR